ncbi:hypothetical protein RHABOEDO_000516 [Candidatus Rhabdochlamydia oedothoracis]|uniref:Uncharacterized protein n=1 Tax=Candidatus Rhabdochlamydia oedothoracis TaxID=2720720 RepID=A0ABX8V561_9BACT|nr:hypothetical protein RHABOEDO_000516 [Candidatus Rhabdochlamydia oedothoracis]
MFFAITKVYSDNFFRFLIYDYFDRMLFLFSGVKMLLSIIAIFYPLFIFVFFWGRSIGVSDASIRITSYSMSLLRRAFFPGCENFLLLIHVSSTHLQAR